MYKATQTRIQTYLNDVAGVRIVCAFIDDNRLDEQIRQAVLSLETKWTEKEIGFQVELEEVKYTANEGLFMHIWINLLDNAIKFSPSKGTITMFLKQEQDSVKFILEDEVCQPAGTSDRPLLHQKPRTMHRFAVTHH